MAGMAFCSVNGITRAFDPACGALAARVPAGELPALGALTLLTLRQSPAPIGRPGRPLR